MTKSKTDPPDVTPKGSKDASMDMDAIRAVELVPDAWPKFEALVKSAGEMGHRPHQFGGNPKKAKRA